MFRIFRHLRPLNFQRGITTKSASFSKSLDILEYTATQPAYRLVDLDGTIDPEYELPLNDQQLVKMYKDMVLTSTLDSILYEAQRQGRLSFYMVSAGEEGIAVGSAAALSEDDQLFCQYREQGALIHRGLTLDDIMAQVFYTSNDEGKGRMMPVHYTNKNINLHPISSPLTSQLPHAAGAAYALKLSNKQAVAACYFGEGAASEGDFHAALNIASTRDCPALFICRNNGYAISTPAKDQYRGDGIFSRAVGYGIPALRVDGNDILAVFRATKAARELAIEKNTPVLIEAMSYRVAHHSTSDDSFAYRQRAEVNDWKQRDNPITRFRKYLEKRELWDDKLESAEKSATRKAVLSKMTEAEPQLKPNISALFTDVWEEMPKHLQEQKAEMERLIKEYPEEFKTDSFERN